MLSPVRQSVDICKGSGVNAKHHSGHRYLTQKHIINYRPIEYRISIRIGTGHESSHRKNRSNPRLNEEKYRSS